MLILLLFINTHFTDHARIECSIELFYRFVILKIRNRNPKEHTKVKEQWMDEFRLFNDAADSKVETFCLKVLNIVSHVDNFQRLSLPTSWTGVLPSVKRPPCQKVVIWKFLTLYRQSNNAVGLRLFSEMGISTFINAHILPHSPIININNNSACGPCIINIINILIIGPYR